MIISKNIASLVGLAVAVVGLLTYSFISAQTWSNAPANPPANNAPAPINVGASNQTKEGSFGAGRLESRHETPSIDFIDTDNNQADWRFWTNDTGFHLRFDRNNDGNWWNDGWARFQVEAGATAADDYFQSNMQMRAPEYCNSAGTNCFTAADVNNVSCVVTPVIRSIPVSFSGSGSVGCGWNDFDCMANFCQSEYGGWAGYHAAALRVSGNSISSFVCYDWELRSSCNNPTITPNDRPY